MKRVAALVTFMLLFCGCSKNNSDVNRIISLRESIASANECSFTVQIIADYQSESYTFKMDCNTDEVGNVRFSVTEPETIAGIKGTVSADGGKLIFDDKYLVFAPLADGLLTPVSAPWIFMNTLRSGYISGCSDMEDGSSVVFTDSYQNITLDMRIIIDSNSIPSSAEIYWQGRRVVTLIVENFTIV